MMFLNKGHIFDRNFGVALTAIAFISLASGRGTTGSTPFPAMKQSQILRNFALRRRLPEDTGAEDDTTSPTDTEAEEPTTEPENTSDETTDDTTEDGTETGEVTPTTDDTPAETENVDDTGIEALEATDAIEADATADGTELLEAYVWDDTIVNEVLADDDELRAVIHNLADGFENNPLIADDTIDLNEQQILETIDEYYTTPGLDATPPGTLQMLSPDELIRIEDALSPEDYSLFLDRYYGQSEHWTDTLCETSAVPYYAWIIIGAGILIALAFAIGALVLACTNKTTGTFVPPSGII